jgi:hypothetical protein
MPEYSAQVAVEDRWAIAAYIRALQLSQKATQADVASGEHVQPLEDIEKDEGFDPGFAREWTLPPTAITGTNTGETYVLPSAATSEAKPETKAAPKQAAPAPAAAPKQ